MGPAVVVSGVEPMGSGAAFVVGVVAGVGSAASLGAAVALVALGRSVSGS